MSTEEIPRFTQLIDEVLGTLEENENLLDMVVGRLVELLKAEPEHDIDELLDKFRDHIKSNMEQL